MEAYMGYVMFTAGTYAPQAWALCLGQTMGISQNAALYALLGTTYGGDGSSNFMLPHLGGRTPIGTGQAPGVGQNFQPGEAGGSAQVTISSQQMPQHIHTTNQLKGVIQAVTNNTAGGTLNEPENGNLLGVGFASGGTASIYVPAGGSQTTANLGGVQLQGTTDVAGGSQPLSIMQPYLAMNAVICIQGLYPPRS